MRTVFLPVSLALGIAGCLDVPYGGTADDGGGGAAGGLVSAGGTPGAGGDGGSRPETCNNLVDDDGDMAVDCLDDDCDCGTIPIGWTGPLALGDACLGEGVPVFLSSSSRGMCQCTCDTTPCFVTIAESPSPTCDNPDPPITLPTNTCWDHSPGTEGVTASLTQGTCTTTSTLPPVSSESSLLCPSEGGTCIQAEGTLECPPGYSVRALDGWRALDDQRTCACACTVPACTAFATGFGQAGCNGGMTFIPISGGCEDARQSIRATYMTTTCMAPDVRPEGEIVGSMPVTVCCSR
jgi:hypothetical protein